MMISVKGTVGMSLVLIWEGQFIDVSSMFRNTDAMHNTRQYENLKREGIGIKKFMRWKTVGS